MTSRDDDDEIGANGFPGWWQQQPLDYKLNVARFSSDPHATSHERNSVPLLHQCTSGNSVWTEERRNGRIPLSWKDVLLQLTRDPPRPRPPRPSSASAALRDLRHLGSRIDLPCHIIALRLHHAWQSWPLLEGLKFKTIICMLMGAALGPIPFPTKLDAASPH